MQKLRHEESGKFNKMPTRKVDQIPYSDEDGKVKNTKQGNAMGATVRIDFTGDQTSQNSPIVNDLGNDTSSGNDVGVKRDLRDGNSNPSASVRNLPPNSDLRGRNNKSWDVQK